MATTTSTLTPEARLRFARWLVETGRLNDGAMKPAQVPTTPTTPLPAPLPGCVLVSPAAQIATQAAALLDWIAWVPRTVGQPDIHSGAWEHVLAAARDLAQLAAQHARGELRPIETDDTPF